MGYQVCGAAAVVELNDGQPDVLNTGSKVYLEEGAAVPEGVKDKCIEHLLEVGLIEKAADSDEAKPRRGGRAADSDEASAS